MKQLPYHTRVSKVIRVWSPLCPCLTKGHAFARPSGTTFPGSCLDSRRKSNRPFIIPQFHPRKCAAGTRCARPRTRRTRGGQRVAEGKSAGLKNWWNRLVCPSTGVCRVRTRVHGVHAGLGHRGETRVRASERARGFELAGRRRIERDTGGGSVGSYYKNPQNNRRGGH